MVLGFNHNVMYKGDVFHVQTEDSGIAIPHIITLLYRGGVILCSKKTSYADILKMETIEVVVEELMKEQHKEMMRRLKAGEFDDRAFPGGVPVAGGTEEPVPPPAPTSAQARPPAPTVRENEPPSVTMPSFSAPLPSSAADRPEQTLTGRITLDDAIVAFFAAHEK
jgi:hypothetical protein